MTAVTVVRRAQRVLVVDEAEDGDVIIVETTVEALVRAGYLYPAPATAVCELDGCDVVFVVVPTGMGADKRFCSRRCASRYAVTRAQAEHTRRREHQAQIRRAYP